ncbi:MAG: hypothetical protein IJN71_02935, partial [Oscillospiraceae bacterium]|nr:hypothetical protein [Oscillospiraceae bacterium]
MKKFISIILALALTVSVLPTAFAFQGDADLHPGTSYTYVFNSSAHNINDSVGADRELTSGKHTIEATNTADSPSRWGFVHCKSHNSLNTHNNIDLTWNWLHKGMRPVFSNDSAPADGMTSILVLELEAGKAGTYTPSLTYVPLTMGVEAEVYLIEKPENADDWYYSAEDATGEKLHDLVKASISSNDRIGSFDAYGTGTDPVPVYFERKTLKANTNYFLIIIPNETDPNWLDGRNDSYANYAGFRLKSFVLNEVTTAEELNYITTVAALNMSKLPAVPASYTAQGKRSDAVLDNLDLADWKKTFALDSTGAACDPYDIMNLNATDAYSVEYPNVPEVYSEAHGKNIKIVYGSNSWNMTKGSGIMADFATVRYGDPYAQTRSQVTLRVNVPFGGTYKMSACGYKAENGAEPTVSFGKAPAQEISGMAWIGEFNTIFKDFTTVGKWSCKTQEGVTAATYTDIGTVTASEPGEYFIVFHMADAYTGTAKNELFYLSGIKLTPVVDTAAQQAAVEKAEITSVTGNPTESSGTAGTSVTVQQLAAVINGTAKVVNADVSLNADGTATLTAAPEYGGGKFLYWAKAANINEKNKFVSADEEYTFKPTIGNNMLIAVYSASGDITPKFYNANRQLLDLTMNGEELPELPTMQGFGQAERWEDCGNGIYVAYYPETPADKYTITLKQQNGNAEAVEFDKIKDVAYGKKVTATAYARYDGNGY